MRRYRKVALIALLTASCSRPSSPPPPSSAVTPPPSPGPAVAGQSELSQPGPPFLIAALGWDDAIAPLARFTGEQWVTTWPPSDEANVPVPLLQEIPDRWLGQPVPREWKLWQNGSSRVVKVIGARRGERDKTAGCVSPAVLDLEKPAGSPAYFFGERGVAVNTDQVIDAFRVIDQTSDEWRAMSAGVLAAVRDAEQLAFAREDHAWLDRQLVEAKLTLSGLSLAVEVSQPVNPAGTTSSTYYFEIARKTTTPAGVAGFRASGWIRRLSAPGNWITTGVTASTISDEGQFTLSPLVRLRVAGREFWLMFVGGIEYGGNAIYEVTPTGVTKVLEISGSGC